MLDLFLQIIKTFIKAGAKSVLLEQGSPTLGPRQLLARGLLGTGLYSGR